MKQTQRTKQLQRQIRQLILLRETGPKSAAWHSARARLIWRLQDEIKREEQLGLQGGGVAERAEPIEDRR